MLVELVIKRGIKGEITETLQYRVSPSIFDWWYKNMKRDLEHKGDKIIPVNKII